MRDYVIRGMAYDNEVRFFAAYTKELTEEARKIHGLSPVCTAALGRTLTAGAMMGAMAKDETEVLTIRLTGDGPAGGVTVTAYANCDVKGLVYRNVPELMIRPDGHLDVGGAIGHTGTLQVIRDSAFGRPYVGETALVSGEVAEDLTLYFAESEQIPTSVALGVLVGKDTAVEHAGGFIIQLMPYASEETVSRLEDALKNVHSVTDFFLKGDTPEDMMAEILGKDIDVEDTFPTRYHCNCSRDRVTRAIISLGRKEVDGMISDGKPVTLHCDFCNKDYTFTVPELQEIRQKM